MWEAGKRHDIEILKVSIAAAVCFMRAQRLCPTQTTARGLCGTVCPGVHTHTYTHTHPNVKSPLCKTLHLQISHRKQQYRVAGHTVATPADGFLSARWPGHASTSYADTGEWKAHTPACKRLTSMKVKKQTRMSVHPHCTTHSDVRAHTHTHTHTHTLPTIFLVEVDLHLPLLRPQQSLGHLGDGQPLGVRSVQEVACARLLHDLGTCVTTHAAEAIVAEDDGAVLHPCVGDDELATWRQRWRKSRPGSLRGELMTERQVWVYFNP